MKNVDQSKIQAAMAELAQQQRVKQEAARLRWEESGRMVGCPGTLAEIDAPCCMPTESLD